MNFSKVMVFCGTVKGKVFGLKFVEGTMKARDYHEHVLEVCIPQIKAINGGNGNGAIPLFFNTSAF